ncbi:MAG TPA: hypothetical protein VGK25_10720 [Ignavibacteria bacterium]
MRILFLWDLEVMFLETLHRLYEIRKIKIKNKQPTKVIDKQIRELEAKIENLKLIPYKV